MPAYQLGSGVGTVVGPQASSADEGVSATEVLGPDSPAGQAMWLAVGSLLVLAFIAGRREGSVVGKLGAAIEFVALVFLASNVGNWGARTWVGMHPDAPFSAGIRFDS